MGAEMPLTPQQNMLWALQMKGNVYSGLVPKSEVRKRRRKNKVAGQSRRKNRGK